MITHILRDGTVLKDITGHVVKVKEAKAIYQLLKERSRNERIDGHTETRAGSQGMA